MIREWSLERRMLAAASVWLVCGIGVGIAALVWAFEGAVVERFDSKLEFVTIDLAETIADDNGISAPSDAHPSFSEPTTGWFWILEQDGVRLTSTPDPVLTDLPLAPPLAAGALRFADATGPGDVPMRVATTTVSRTSGSAVLAVLIDRREIDRELRSFGSLLLVAIAVLALSLLGGLIVQTRIALAPLRRLRADLADVESGRLEAVAESYPPDIRPVAEAMNAVIERDQAVAAWARKSAGNLAHALKTELALLRQLARDRSESEKLAATTDRIAGIVDHHLSRATAGPARSSRGRADTRAVVTAVSQGLTRLFAHRALAIEADVTSAPYFRGEVQDLEEIVGNLMENACRHAHSRVLAQAHPEGNRLVIVVQDDGDGLVAQQREVATRRGERLDEKGPGSGLGLAIVNDLTELYGGSLALTEARIGGLEARVDLPAA